MSDKHMDEVMRDFAKKCKECDYCIEPQEEEACRECERKFIKKACRSYARKVVEELLEKCDLKDRLRRVEIVKIISRLTDKEPT